MTKLKTFRIWHSNGKPENIQADRAEFIKQSDGLSIIFFTGKKKHRIKGVVMMTEMVEQTIIEISRQPMIDHDED